MWFKMILNTENMTLYFEQKKASGKAAISQMYCKLLQSYVSH